jgi:glycosyltransferase involved in cell wall biosynthesis
MKIAIIDDLAAHYRLTLFRLLSQQGDPEYTIFASKETHNGVAVIDPGLASLSPENGGLRWNFIDNIVVIKRIIWQKGIISLCSKSDFDIYIFPGEFHIISTWVAWIICKRRRKKIVFWGHGIYGNEKFLKKFIRNLFNRLPDAYLVHNERSEELMVHGGLPAERLFVIHNSLNYDVHKNIRNSFTDEAILSLKAAIFKADPDLPVLFFIGRLTREKKLDLLIKSMSILKSKGTKVNCVIVGGGDQEFFLKKLVNRFSLDDYVVFYGPEYDENKNGLLISMADCCISPGNVGLNAIHSLSFGTPVITHGDFKNQGPEVSSVIPDITGELYERNNYADLSEKIFDLIFNKGKSHYSDNCIKIINDYYNPYYQMEVMASMVKFLFVKEDS